MYNANVPTQMVLPSNQQLRRSTIVAILSAAAILVTVVLPAEYGIDPTGVGRVLNLTEMGQIKTQLAAEAATDQAATAAAPVLLTPAATPSPSTPPAALATNPPSAPAKIAPAATWRDETRFKLTPGEGIEIKLSMKAGAKADYAWAVDGGVVNFDTHGDGGGRSISYEKGRGVPADEGQLEAAFDGNHGWFWRNRGSSDVTVVLRTKGDYTALKRM